MSQNLVTHAFRDAVNAGWFVDLKTSVTFCPDCAVEVLQEKNLTADQLQEVSDKIPFPAFKFKEWLN